MWLLNHAHYYAAVTASTPLGRLSTRSWWDCSHLTRRASVRSPTDVGWWGQMCQMGSRSGLFTRASITNHEHGSHFPKSIIKWNWLGVLSCRCNRDPPQTVTTESEPWKQLQTKSTQVMCQCHRTIRHTVNLMQMLLYRRHWVTEW